MIQVNNISKSFAGQVLFENLSFNLPAGARVGLVGRNGSGKSTLFKLILGEESLDSGEISLPKNYRIGTLKQHIEFSKPSVAEECYQVLTGEAKYETYKVDKILSGLGFTQAELNKDPHSFSGGYQIRINLAKVLATEPNLLLLDEPTNYLDIVSMRWLRNFLIQFEGEVIIITHDREFMDEVTTHTMGLSRKQLKMVKGDTRKFYSQLLEEDELYEKTRANFDKKRKEMERFVERFRAKASKASQAQSKLKQLEKMGEMDELASEADLEFNFNYKEIPSKNILQVENLSFGYTENLQLFSDISFHLEKGECLGIIGKNGKGKSTLLNCLAGELKPLKGETRFHPSCSYAHFGQTNIERLHPQNSIVEEVTEVAPELPHAKIRQICGTMMFSGDLADKKISVLSGGERSRVMLAKIMAKPSNLLFLDEPTNHLDMQSIESLADAITQFAGATIIVTHSEMLLRRLASKLIIFHHDGAELFLGDYDDFLAKMGWEEELNSNQKIAKPKISKKELQKLRSEIIKERSSTLNPLKKQIESLEKRITKNEKQLNQKNLDLVNASQNSDGELISQLSIEVSDLENAIERDFEVLAEIQEKHDQSEQSFEEKLGELNS
ncbi:MAG: ABC transporter ATP-binding protein [Halobacteriovoraceae bacterium]|nr:ABC transporter ATP-binding protein [Halobacteriovoraceae bacterium]